MGNEVLNLSVWSEKNLFSMIHIVSKHNLCEQFLPEMMPRVESRK